MKIDFSIENFLKTAAADRNLSPLTLKAYLCDLRDFKRGLAPDRIASATADDIRTYLLSCRHAGLRTSTIRRRLATVRLFYGWLERERLIPESPATSIRGRFQQDKRLPRIIPLQNVEKVLRAAYADARDVRHAKGRSIKGALAARNWAMVETLFSTGIRSHELTRSNVKDLDLHRKTIYIAGKGRRERLLYFSANEAVQALQAYIDRRPDLRPTTDAMFVNRFGHRLGVQSVAAVFDRLLTTAGVRERCTPHMLRHTMATLLIENGADTRSAQEILGHSNVRTTEIYVDVSKSRKEAILTRYNPRNSIQLGVSLPN